MTTRVFSGARARFIFGGQEIDGCCESTEISYAPDDPPDHVPVSYRGKFTCTLTPIRPHTHAMTWRRLTRRTAPARERRTQQMLRWCARRARRRARRSA